MLYPSAPNKWQRRFLDLATLVSTWSKDPSTKCGAVIVSYDHRIVSVGYNGFARGVEDSLARLEHREVKYSMVLHAEENAILFANECKNKDLYVYPFAPCSHCASLIVQSGISAVYFPYQLIDENTRTRWQESHRIAATILREGRVNLHAIDLSIPDDYGAALPQSYRIGDN